MGVQLVTAAQQHMHLLAPMLSLPVAMARMMQTGV
jgi:hypothetical protein